MEKAFDTFQDMNTINKTIKILLPFGKVWLGSLVCLLLLVSCRTVRVEEPVIVERIQHDTIRVADVRSDSIYLKDSIYIHAIGDTIYRDRWRTKYVERKVRYDSIVSVHDTIPVITTITKIEKERFTPWYMKALAFLGALTLITTFLIGIAFLKDRW